MKVLLSPTERRDKVQFIDFKESIITNVLENFKQPADIVKFINPGSITVIPLPKFTNFMKEYDFTNANALTTEGNNFCPDYLPTSRRNVQREKVNHNRTSSSYMKFWGKMFARSTV